MCQLCPGNFEFIEEKVGDLSPVLHSGDKNQNTKTIRKKIVRPMYVSLRFRSYGAYGKWKGILPCMSSLLTNEFYVILKFYQIE